MFGYMFVYMLSSLSGEFGRLRRGTFQMVNAEFGRQLLNQRAAKKSDISEVSEHVECLHCFVDRAVKRDPSIQLIDAEFSEDKDAEDPGESLDDIKRENAQFESERQFDKFVSEKD